jgi:single-strand DNA-binding protein
MIKLQVIGNLGRDAVINTVNGKTVINFTVAHSEKYKDQQGNMQERTTWVDCAYWTEANVGQYLMKGKTVFVEGTPHVEVYTTKDGKQGASLRLRVREMQFVGGSNRDNQQQSGDNQYNQSAPQSAPAPAVQTFTNTAAPGFDNGGAADDLPF